MPNNSPQIQRIILVHISCWVLAWSQSWHILTWHGTQVQITQDHEYLDCIIVKFLANEQWDSAMTILSHIGSLCCLNMEAKSTWESMTKFLIVLLEIWRLRLTRGLLAVVMIPGIMINLETCSDYRQNGFQATEWHFKYWMKFSIWRHQ